MGVMACDRRGCENVMCDYYSYKYGYLCNSCMVELKNTPMKEISIEKFMETPKKEQSPVWGDYALELFRDFSDL